MKKLLKFRHFANGKLRGIVRKIETLIFCSQLLKFISCCIKILSFSPPIIQNSFENTEWTSECQVIRHFFIKCSKLKFIFAYFMIYDIFQKRTKKIHVISIYFPTIQLYLRTFKCGIVLLQFTNFTRNTIYSERTT